MIHNVRTSIRRLDIAGGAMSRHPGVALTTGLIGVAIAANAALRHDLGRAILYLAVILVSVGLIELVLARWPIADRATPVRRPGTELAVITASFVAGIWWLYERFVHNYRPASGLGRLAWLGVLVGCVFHALPAVYLLARRYRPSELGIRLSGLRAAPPIILMFALAAALFAPASLTWKGIVDETGGSAWGIISTAVVASVPEEFFRFVWQTRMTALARNPALAWLVASLLWALLHGPKDWDESHALGATAMGVINIVPLGLLWGCLTHRTRSILPSILLHATNVWGLQNLS
jgi:membrane protease YdiL (CAAX protease family)